MVLPTNNSRPAIPYVPEQVLPNYDRYESLGQFPPTAQQLDGDLNKMIDLINTLSDEINNVVVGALPGADDPLNANSLMTTDGEGNISWVKAASANLDDGAVTTSKIADAAITPEKIQPQAISTEKLENEAVTTPKINPGAITTGTISDGAVTTAKIANNAVTSNKIPNTSIAGAQLQNQTITNAQIANQTITAAQIANQTITAAQIANQTITAAQIANQTITAAQIANQTITAAQIANQTITAAQIANQTITAAQIANQTITAAQIANQTITATQLQNAGQMVPFAMGYVYGNGAIQKSFNIASVTRTATGYYLVRFIDSAPDNKYILVFGVAGVNNYYMQAEEAQNSRTTGGFNVRMGSGTTDMDGEFNFVVYAF